MSVIKPIGKKKVFHYIRYVSGGKWFKKSLKTSDRRIARLEQTRLDEQFDAGKSPASGVWSAFRDAYLKHSEIRKSHATLLEDRHILGRFERDVKPYRLAEIRRHQIQEWIDGLDVSNITRNKYFRHIKAAFNWGYENSYFTHRVTEGIKQIRVELPFRRVITKEEIKKLFKAAKEAPRPDAYLFLLILCYTGVRVSEMLGLLWEDVQGDFLRIRNTKGKKVRHIPMIDELKKELEKHTRRPEERIIPLRSRFQASMLLSHLAFKAGIDQINLHLLRHSFASNYMMSGGNPKALQNFLGHTNSATTDRYVHLSTDYLKNEIKKIR